MSISVVLSEVAEVNPRTTTEGLQADDAVDFFPMAAVDAEKTVARASERRALAQVSKGFTSFQDGDVLLAKITPCFENGKISQAAVTTPVAFGSTEFHVVRCGANLDSRYLVHFLRRQEIRVDGERKMTGSGGQRRVPRHFLESLEIPLPPVAEQRRIALILDKADAMRTKRGEALAQLDRLTRSIFMEMFGDPLSNSKGWPEERLDATTECLDRLRKPVTESERPPGDIPYYGANGQQGWINEHLFDEPLVLVAEDGGHFEQPSRGVAYRVDGKSWVNNHAHILRPKPDKLDIEYLHRALRNFNFVPYISGTTRSKLTQGQLNSVKLMIPPLRLQKQFADRVEHVSLLGAKNQAAAQSLDALFSSLQERAFRGEL